MTRRLRIAAVALFLSALAWGSDAPKKDKPPDKVPEYDLLLSCVETVRVDPVRFHCVIDDVNNPKGILCDEKSFSIILKKGSTTDNCTTIHMVPKAKGPQN